MTAFGENAMRRIDQAVSPLVASNVPWAERRKTRRSKRRASEEGRPSSAGYDAAGIAGLPARPDREEDAEKEKAEDKGQGQEKDGQDQEWDRKPGDHCLLPSIILGRSRPFVNKEGVKPVLSPFINPFDISQKCGSEPLRRTSDGRF
jgi:hypothetical protein